MTKATLIALASHTETPDDTSGTVTWPATSALVCDPGDYILKNRGLQTTYTSAGGVTLTFGAFFDGAAFVGTATGQTATNAYDKPYACVAPGVIDFTDEAFLDVEIFGDVGYALDITTGEYPVTLRSGDLNVHGQHIVNNAVSPNHLHGSHAATGHFAGGTLKIDPETTGTGNNSLDFVVPNQNDAIYFVTDDGSGDSDYVGSSGKDGAFLLTWGTSASGGANGLAGWVSAPVIGRNSSGDHFTQSAWPTASGPALSMVAFCRLFPGSPTAVAVAGGSFGTNTWCFRFAFYKTLSLDTKVNGVLTTNGATQVIETPLSTPLFINTTSGAQSVQLTMPAVPSGWDGVNIYLGTGSFPATMVKNASYATAGSLVLYGSAAGTKSGTTVTFTAPQTGWVVNGPGVASCGFSAWPPGTRLAKDPRAVQFDLMKIAHVDTALDSIGNKFPISPFNGGMTQAPGGSTVGLGTLAAQHLNGLTGIGAFAGKGQPIVTDGSNNQSWGRINAPNGMHSKVADNTTNATSGFVPTADGSGNVTWQAQSSSGMTNPMTTGGDIIFGGISGSPARLAAGSAFTVLQISSGNPIWDFLTGNNFASQTGNRVMASPNGFTGQPTFRQLVAADFSTFTAGQIFLSNGSINKTLIILDAGDFGSFTGDSSGNFSSSVSFHVTFPATPIVGVFMAGNWNPTGDVRVYANSISTFGFTINVAGDAPSTTRTNLYWHAILPPSSW